MKSLDLTGKRFGKLVVLNMIYDEKTQNFGHCKCLCDCGNEVIKNVGYLKRAKTIPSCGCDYRRTISKIRGKDIVGKKFGRLLIVKDIYDNPPKVKCVCDCGNKVVLRRNDVMTGHTRSCGCLQKEAIKRIKEKDDTDYISDFGVKILKQHKRNNKNQMLWECECGYCGRHFYELPAKIKNNHVRSCGCLTSSSMESFIEKFLMQNNINYETQYTYDDCLNNKGNKLRFDFAIKDNNNNVKYLIEYDGEQHYKSVEYFGGEEGFVKRKEYDEIKNKYCKLNNIRLLRLPYYLTNDEIINQITNIINP